MDKLEQPSTSFLVKYVGSFMVVGHDQEERLNCVRTHLEAMKRTMHNSKPVLLDASSSGIRVLSVDGQTSHMVHALKRVSYATCEPDACQFAFSARQPSDNDGSKMPPSQHPLPGVQYCHVFSTESPQQAKEVNDYVSGIFRDAERRWRDRSSTSSASSSNVSARDQDSERERKEKRSVAIMDSEGRCLATNHSHVEDQSSIDKLAMDVGFNANESRTYDEYAPFGSKSTSSRSSYKKTFPSIDNPSPKNDFRRSKHHIEYSPTGQKLSIHGEEKHLNNTNILPEMAAISRALDEGITKLPLRPESKRQKRRPLSAVLTNFGASKKKMASSMDVSGEEKCNEIGRRPSLLDGFSIPNKESNKNGSIFRRLLNLKIGCGSSLRLNLLTDSSSAFASDHSPMSQNGRQRSSQSVRFLGSSLDHADEAPCPNGTALPVATKRRRRPLSAVFGNATTFHTSQNGHVSHVMDTPNGVHNGFMNGGTSVPVDLPNGTKKMGSTRSAVSKMFGFSSSRRKSRSSAHLDTVIRRQITLSSDLDITDSVHDSRDSALRKPYQHHQPPSVDDVSHWKQPIPTLDDGPPTNGSSPLLGSGVGCGEHCSISMPNLRYGMELTLPLSLEEETKLIGAAWFYGIFSRQQAAQVLENEPEGAFVVRYSVSQPSSSLVLSVRVPFSHNPSGVSHYLIIHTAKGFKLKGFTKDFPSVHALVTHHSFMAEQLPCRLVFTDRDPTDVVRSYRALFNASACALSSDNNAVNSSNDRQSSYQYHHQKRSSHSRHSSPFVTKRYDLVPVTEEESIYGKLPSPPPPPAEQASSTLFAALRIADTTAY